jgi:hypothetical protein
MFGVQKSKPVLFFSQRGRQYITRNKVPVSIVKRSCFGGDDCRYLGNKGVVESRTHQDRLREAGTVAIFTLFAEVCVGSSDT